jgi:hypothetical protein
MDLRDLPDIEADPQWQLTVRVAVELTRTFTTRNISQTTIHRQQRSGCLTNTVGIKKAKHRPSLLNALIKATGRSRPRLTPRATN